MAAEEYPKVYLYRRIVQAKLFIDAHYAENMELFSMADEAYFSKFHFTRIFKKVYGQTPHQYLIKVRVEQAAMLLRNKISVSDACHQVGFTSLSSFSGLFKKLVGKSPSAYLADQQQLKVETLTTPLQFVPACFASQSGWIK